MIYDILDMVFLWLVFSRTYLVPPSQLNPGPRHMMNESDVMFLYDTLLRWGTEVVSQEASLVKQICWDEYNIIVIIENIPAIALSIDVYVGIMFGCNRLRLCIPGWRKFRLYSGAS